LHGWGHCRVFLLGFFFAFGWVCRRNPFGFTSKAKQPVNPFEWKRHVRNMFEFLIFDCADVLVQNKLPSDVPSSIPTPQLDFDSEMPSSVPTIPFAPGMECNEESCTFYETLIDFKVAASTRSNMCMCAVEYSLERAGTCADTFEDIIYIIATRDVTIACGAKSIQCRLQSPNALFFVW